MTRLPSRHKLAGETLLEVLVSRPVPAGVMLEVVLPGVVSVLEEVVLLLLSSCELFSVLTRLTFTVNSNCRFITLRVHVVVPPFFSWLHKLNCNSSSSSRHTTHVRNKIYCQNFVFSAYVRSLLTFGYLFTLVFLHGR